MSKKWGSLLEGSFGVIKGYIRLHGDSPARDFQRVALLGFSCNSVTKASVCGGYRWTHLLRFCKTVCHYQGYWCYSCHGCCHCYDDEFTPSSPDSMVSMAMALTLSPQPCTLVVPVTSRLFQSWLLEKVLRLHLATAGVHICGPLELTGLLLRNCFNSHNKENLFTMYPYDGNLI